MNRNTLVPFARPSSKHGKHIVAASQHVVKLRELGTTNKNDTDSMVQFTPNVDKIKGGDELLSKVSRSYAVTSKRRLLGKAVKTFSAENKTRVPLAGIKYPTQPSPPDFTVPVWTEPCRTPSRSPEHPLAMSSPPPLCRTPSSSGPTLEDVSATTRMHFLPQLPLLDDDDDDDDSNKERRTWVRALLPRKRPRSLLDFESVVGWEPRYE